MFHDKIAVAKRFNVLGRSGAGAHDKECRRADSCERVSFHGSTLTGLLLMLHRFEKRRGFADPCAQLQTADAEVGRPRSRWLPVVGRPSRELSCGRFTAVEVEP